MGSDCYIANILTYNAHNLAFPICFNFKFKLTAKHRSRVLTLLVFLLCSIREFCLLSK